MAKRGTRAFLSYRGDDYNTASALAQHLVDTGAFGSITLIPPEKLSRTNEVLLVFEYFELMEFIVDSMHASDAFLVLDMGSYWNSYWTQTEVLQWRRFARRAEVEVFGPDARGEAIIHHGAAPLEPLSKRELQLWARISVGTNRAMVQGSRLPQFWGKFARSCFLIPCPSCKRHFLATQKAVEASLEGEFAVPCSHCRTVASFEVGAQRGTFYRKPILLRKPGGRPRTPGEAPAAPLGALELTSLLVASEVPPEFGLVALPGEKLHSDAVKVLKMYGWMAAGLGAAVLLASLFEDDGE